MEEKVSPEDISGQDQGTTLYHSRFLDPNYII
jgi:hypothetical protein